MSFILNALRKSEQERQASQAGTLENSILEIQETKQKKTSIWAIILVLFNLFFIAYFIWSFGKEEENNSVSQTKQEVTSKPQEINKNLELAKLNKTKTTIKPTHLSIANKVQSQQEKNSTVINKPENKKIKKPLPSVKQEKIPKNVAIIPQEKLKVEKSIIKNSIVNNQDNSNAPPFLSELDYEFRRTVPAININVFVYSKNKQESFILANMKKYLAEQEFESGMKLKEIRKNSIVVEYENKVFQIKR